MNHGSLLFLFLFLTWLYCLWFGFLKYRYYFFQFDITYFIKFLQLLNIFKLFTSEFQIPTIRRTLYKLFPIYNCISKFIPYFFPRIV